MKASVETVVSKVKRVTLFSEEGRPGEYKQYSNAKLPVQPGKEEPKMPNKILPFSGFCSSKINIF